MRLSMENNRPLRVLHIVGGVMDVGGTETFLMSYYRNINRDLVQFDFCILEEGESQFDHEIRTLGGRIYNLPSKKRQPINHLKGLLKVLKEYQNYPVHMHLDGMNGFYGLIALLNSNKIRISHSHNTNHLTSNLVKVFIHDISRFVNRYANSHYAACSGNASIWLHGHRNLKKSNIVLNAIKTNDFDFNEQLRIQYRKKYNIADAIVIGHVGRFHNQKNHRFMIEIVKKLAKEKLNFKMVFLGGGELFEAIQKDVIQNNLEDYVLFLGKKSDPHNYYHMMDLFILPSIFEGLGIAIVEAQTNGLPCIVTDTIPSESIFKENVTRLPINTVDPWISQIKTSNLRREYVEINPYNINLSTQKLTDYYMTLVKNTNN